VANSFGGSVVWLPTSRMTIWVRRRASSEQEDVTHACYHTERNIPQHLCALTKISAPTKTNTSVEMHLDESTLKKPASEERRRFAGACAARWNTTSGEDPQLVRLHG
jgi:hypothetical protein